VASALFSWYAASFGKFNETYGSLGAVIGFMTWLWISAIVILLGGRTRRRDGASDRARHDDRLTEADGIAGRQNGRHRWTRTQRVTFSCGSRGIGERWRSLRPDGASPAALTSDARAV
jgi:hypothetical protein